VFYLLMALVGVVWIGWREGRIPLATFINPDAWGADLGLGLGGGLLLVGAWELASRLLPAAREVERRLSEVLGPLRGGDAIGLAVLSGFAEEFFFRGAVQGSWGWLWASVLFAVLHSGPGSEYRLWTLFAAVAGFLLGGMMAWRGNLLAPVVAHVVTNGVNLLRMARRAREGTGS
jgi:membrane protease YdiL (CAAX protease family)